VALTEGHAFCTRRGEIGSTVGPGHLCFRGDYGLPLMNDERCTVYDVLRIVCQTRCAAGSRLEDRSDRIEGAVVYIACLLLPTG
jgi:hypothetical protein